MISPKVLILMMVIIVFSIGVGLLLHTLGVKDIIVKVVMFGIPFMAGMFFVRSSKKS